MVIIVHVQNYSFLSLCPVDTSLLTQNDQSCRCCSSCSPKPNKWQRFVLNSIMWVGIPLPMATWCVSDGQKCFFLVIFPCYSRSPQLYDLEFASQKIVLILITRKNNKEKTFLSVAQCACTTCYRWLTLTNFVWCHECTTDAGNVVWSTCIYNQTHEVLTYYPMTQFPFCIKSTACDTVYN